MADAAPPRSRLTLRELGAIAGVLALLSVLAAAWLLSAASPAAPAMPAIPTEASGAQASEEETAPAEPIAPAQARDPGDAAQAPEDAADDPPAPAPEPSPPPPAEPEPAPRRSGPLFDPDDPPREPARPSVQSPVGPAESVLAGLTLTPQPALMGKPFYGAVYLRQVDGRAAKEIVVAVDGATVAERKAIDPALEQITFQIALPTAGTHALSAREPTTGEVIGTLLDVLSMRPDSIELPADLRANVPVRILVSISLGLGAKEETLFLYVDGSALDAKRILPGDGDTQTVLFEVTLAPGAHAFSAGFEGSRWTTGTRSATAS